MDRDVDRHIYIYTPFHNLRKRSHGRGREGGVEKRMVLRLEEDNGKEVLQTKRNRDSVRKRNIRVKERVIKRERKKRDKYNVI